MAKLLLSRSRSESRLGRKTKDASKSTESLVVPQKFDEPLPSPMQVPRQAGNLAVEIGPSETRSIDMQRPKTSGGGRSLISKVLNESSADSSFEERPKTSHGPKKGNNALEEPNFSMLNRSYTWTREQSNDSSYALSPERAGSPSIYGFPPRSSSRQQSHPANCEIGVALGSPTHQPKTLLDARSSRMYAPDALFQRSLPQHYVSLESNGNGSRQPFGTSAFAHSDNKDESARNGWKKFFGKGLFKKSSQKPQLSQTSQSSVSQSSQLSSFSQSSMTSNTVSSVADTKQSMDQFTKVSAEHEIRIYVEEDRKSSTEKSKKSKKSKASAPSEPDHQTSLDSLVEEIEEAEALYHPKPVPSTTPLQLLDVEIPKVEMERYSIMFDSLLNHQQQQPQKPSIYARRKSGMGGAAIGQKISETLAEEPMLQLAPKKDSLPLGVNKSPLWLFPATPRTPKSPGRPRAMTTPTEVASPMVVTTPELSTSAAKKSRPESDIIPSLLMMLEERNERSLSKHEKVPPTPFSIISEGSELDSPYSPQHDGSNAPWIRKFSMVEEPEWEMITTTPLRPRTPSPTEVEANDCEAYVAKAATISIARQISVSKRQLLLPVISNPERFVSKNKSVKTMPTPVPQLVIKPPRADVVSPAPTSAVSSEGIAMAL